MRIVYGMDLKSKVVRRKRMAPAERDEALRRLKAGGETKTVAADLGVGRDTVHKSAMAPPGRTGR
jgi:hypothetical protein